MLFSIIYILSPALFYDSTYITSYLHVLITSSQYFNLNHILPITSQTMSSDSLALFRKSASADLQKLADEHLNHEFVLPPFQEPHLADHPAQPQRSRPRRPEIRRQQTPNPRPRRLAYWVGFRRSARLPRASEQAPVLRGFPYCAETHACEIR